ncbi:MAG: DegT/DnrJ/EryC1/StrS family aminotransferase [Cycloclasticus sp.]
MADFFFYRGRWALAAVLKALNVKKGGKVALQGFTCTAVPEAIASIGAVPIFFDVEKSSVNCEYLGYPDSFFSDVSAIVIQHTYGYEADLSRLEYLSNKFDIPVIEDCAHINFLEERRGRMNKCICASFYSFEWGKPIPVGLGGALRLYSEELEAKIMEREVGLIDPPKLKQLKIELQFYAFNLLYRPRFFFVIKEMFEIANKLRLGEANQNNMLSFYESSPEADWKISPRVRTRISKLEIDNIERERQQNHLLAIYQVYKLSLDKWAIQGGGGQEIALRYPVKVVNKADVLTSARKAGIELSDWYSTPVDPLSLQECESIGWHVGHCTRAISLCESVVTLPINSRVSIAQAKKSSNFLKLIMEKEGG